MLRNQINYVADVNAYFYVPECYTGGKSCRDFLYISHHNNWTPAVKAIVFAGLRYLVTQSQAKVSTSRTSESLNGLSVFQCAKYFLADHSSANQVFIIYHMVWWKVTAQWNNRKPGFTVHLHPYSHCSFRAFYILSKAKKLFSKKRVSIKLYFKKVNWLNECLIFVNV